MTVCARGSRSLAGLVTAAICILVAGSAAIAAGAANRPAARGCPPGTKAAVTYAYSTLFGRTLTITPDERAALLVGGDDPAVRVVLDDWLADPAGASSSVNVNAVACPTRTRAVVDTDLVLAGQVLAEVLPLGRARRDHGTWKVAASTFCTHVRLEQPSAADRGACAGR